MVCPVCNKEVFASVEKILSKQDLLRIKERMTEKWKNVQYVAVKTMLKFQNKWLLIMINHLTYINAVTAVNPILQWKRRFVNMISTQSDPAERRTSMVFCPVCSNYTVVRSKYCIKKMLSKQEIEQLKERKELL